MTVRLLRYVMTVLCVSMVYYIPEFVDINVYEVTDCIDKNMTMVAEDVQGCAYEKRDNCTTEYELIPTKGEEKIMYFKDKLLRKNFPRGK